MKVSNVLLWLAIPLIIWSCSTSSSNYQVVTPTEFTAKLKNHNTLILDVRPKAEFEKNQLPGARNLPVNDPEFDNKLKTVSKELKIMVYCHDGLDAEKVAGKISKAGFEVIALQGGITKWAEEGFNVVYKTGGSISNSNFTKVEDEFYHHIEGEKLVMIDFFTTWCGPCKMMAPFVDRLMREKSEEVTIMKIDIDREVGLGQKYKIESIPTLVLFKNGEQLYYKPGYHSYEDMLALIEKYK